MPTLADVPAGAVFLLAASVTARDAGGLHLALSNQDRTVQGTVLVAADLTLTGALTAPLTGVQVTVIAQPFLVGDVVASDVTGESMVVRDTWVGPEGFAWSSTTARRVIYTTAGWTKIGTATLT